MWWLWALSSPIAGPILKGGMDSMCMYISTAFSSGRASFHFVLKMTIVGQFYFYFVLKMTVVVVFYFHFVLKRTVVGHFYFHFILNMTIYNYTLGSLSCKSEFLCIIRKLYFPAPPKLSIVTLYHFSISHQTTPHPTPPYI